MRERVASARDRQGEPSHASLLKFRQPQPGACVQTAHSISRWASVCTCRLGIFPQATHRHVAHLSSGSPTGFLRA